MRGATVSPKLRLVQPAVVLAEFQGQYELLAKILVMEGDFAVRHGATAWLGVWAGDSGPQLVFGRAMA